MPIVKNGRTILLGEDDQEVRTYLDMALKCEGYSVLLAQDGDEVLDYLQENDTPVSAILLDIIMPRRDGLETLKAIRRINQTVPVIMVSGASSPLNVVEAMKNGANDFVAKPVSHEDLHKVLKAVIDTNPVASSEPAEFEASAPKQIFFGFNPHMKELQGLIAQIGRSEAPVLIQGETGAGKEVFARELHAQSQRAKKPFLKLNCAALPSELVESELFGYERGAFTGAFQKKPGMFELADGGTILLDEIGDMDFKLQAKLLQVLQDHEFQRLGGREIVHVDVRVIAATHRDLVKAIAEGTFREDLYYRLNVIGLRVPPLRERKDDIVGMAEFLMKKHAVPGAVPVVITPSLKQAFLNYGWPGNIRELENVMRKLLVLRDPEMITRELRSHTERNAAPRMVPLPGISPDEDSAQAEDTILQQVTKAKQQAERTAIVAALNSTHWNRKQAAVVLKIDYKALLYKMKKLGIEDRMASFPAARNDAPPEVPAAPPIVRRAGGA
jgi:two-component system response regulator AtoC